MYIESNLFNDMPMRDFSLNLMSFMDLGGHEIWTRTLLPDAPGINPDQFPYFLDELKKQLKEQSMAQGGANLHGIRASQWGPLMYSWQPIRNSDGSAPFNGFLLVMRWLDTAYLEQVSQRTELPLAISHTNLDVTASFKPLKSQMTYRLIDLGLDRLRGEVRLLNSDNLPVLTLVIEEERKVLGSVLEGALWTFVGMLFISFICIMIAIYPVAAAGFSVAAFWRSARCQFDPVYRQQCRNGDLEWQVQGDGQQGQPATRCVAGAILSDGDGGVHRSLDPLLQSPFSGWLVAGLRSQALSAVAAGS